MNSTPEGNQPNPHHNPRTSSNSITVEFVGEGVKPDTEEFRTREEFHRLRWEQAQGKQGSPTQTESETDQSEQ